MRVARFTETGEPFAVREVDRPDVGPGEVRIEIGAASLCGSDVHYLDEDSDFDPETVPITLGHEGAGTVLETGPGVEHVATGDRVAIHYVLSCGNCEPCLEGHDNRCRHRRSIGSHVDGTFAEEIAVPARSALPMGDVPVEWGSIAACAVSTPFHALRRANVTAGDTVAVFGAGGVGLHAVLWADVLGAERVIAVDPARAQRDGAREYGADVLLDPASEDAVEAIRAETDGWGADVAVECSGSPAAMDAAIRCVDGANRYESGTVASVGLQHEPLSATYWGLREGELLVSGDHTRAELRTILDLLSAGRVDLSHSITHRVGLEEIASGIEIIEESDERVGRVIVEP
jgi:propanol-preferring alcohol dehydrogenase